MKAKIYVPDNFIGSEQHRTGRCGPGRGVLEKVVPDKILGLSVTIVCAVHDFMYCYGATNEDKAVADRTFKYNLFRLIEARGGIFKYPRYALAQGYYLAVSASGGPAFWDNKNPDGNIMEVEV